MPYRCYSFLCGSTLFLTFLSLHLDSSCGTNGVKKSSDGAPVTQSLFLNNTEHSATLAKSLVRSGCSSVCYSQGLGIKKKNTASQFRTDFVKLSESGVNFRYFTEELKSSCFFFVVFF